MRKVAGLLVLAIGVLASPNAMAVHTCGQMLGSCLPHTDPVVLPKQNPPVQAVPVKRVRTQPIVREPGKCFKESGKGYLIQIPCPR